MLADLREPETILSHPTTRALIDFSQPVGLLLVAILQFITEAENPARILATLRGPAAGGSYLALSHATGDLRPDAAQNAASVYDGATSSVTLRSKAQVETLFDGWELIEPGVVQVPLWRPEGRKPRPKGAGQSLGLLGSRPQDHERIAGLTQPGAALRRPCRSRRRAARYETGRRRL